MPFENATIMDFPQLNASVLAASNGTLPTGSSDNDFFLSIFINVGVFVLFLLSVAATWLLPYLSVIIASWLLGCPIQKHHGTIVDISILLLVPIIPVNLIVQGYAGAQSGSEYVFRNWQVLYWFAWPACTVLAVMSILRSGAQLVACVKRNARTVSDREVEKSDLVNRNEEKNGNTPSLVNSISLIFATLALPGIVVAMSYGPWAPWKGKNLEQLGQIVHFVAMFLLAVVVSSAVCLSLGVSVIVGGFICSGTFVWPSLRQVQNVQDQHGLDLVGIATFVAVLGALCCFFFWVLALLGSSGHQETYPGVPRAALQLGVYAVSLEFAGLALAVLGKIVYVCCSKWCSMSSKANSGEEERELMVEETTSVQLETLQKD